MSEEEQPAAPEFSQEELLAFARRMAAREATHAALWPDGTFEKRAIALEQLETALRLFAAGGEFFSAITLAGAAEEILGQLVRERGGDSALDVLRKGAIAFHRLVHGEELRAKDVVEVANRSKNAAKHHAASEGTVRCSPREEAADLITRAIANYWTLTHDATPAMLTFEKERREAWQDPG